MASKIKGLVSVGNGGDGARVGSGSNLELEDALLADNGCNGLSVSKGANFIGSNIKVINNKGHGYYEYEGDLKGVISSLSSGDLKKLEEIILNFKNNPRSEKDIRELKSFHPVFSRVMTKTAEYASVAGFILSLVQLYLK